MDNNRQTIVTRNITTLQKILNYFRIRNHIPNPASGAYYSSAKWSNSMYRVHIGLSTAARHIEPANGIYPHFDQIGCGDSIISPEMYNTIHSVVLKRQAEFFTQVDEGQVDTVADLVIAILEGSFTLYSMIVALWRTQSGYLFKDEDKVYLGPVFFNHEAKGASVADWNVSANNSFTEEIAQTSLDNQRQIQASNEVWGVYGISNENWANMIEEVLNACYLPANLRWAAEHLFGTVFIDPQPDYTFKSVTLFPDSGINLYSYDANSDKWLNYTSNNLTGYDVNSNDDGATNQDNGGNFNDFVTYYTAWVETIAELFNHYPYLDSILADLKFTNVSNFDFTRDLKHTRIYFVLNENISDFIQSTATPSANPEVPDINDTLTNITSVVPFSVHEDLEVGYGRTLNYSDETEILLDYSLEYLLKGKVFACRFAYFGFDQNNNIGFFRYHFLENRMCSDFTDTAKNLSLMYLNAELNDYGAVETLHNVEMSSFPASGQGGSGIIIVPSVRCYYNALENIETYCSRAYDTFIAPEYQKVK